MVVLQIIIFCAGILITFYFPFLLSRHISQSFCSHQPTSNLFLVLPYFPISKQRIFQIAALIVKVLDQLPDFEKCFAFLMKLQLVTEIKGLRAFIVIIENGFELISMIEKHQDLIFSNEEIRFNRLALDQLKKHDLRILFETLMSEPKHRTVADINMLIKIMLALAPIKKLGNSSVVYHLCNSMYLAKLKEKSFVYQSQEDAESLYIILNGKIGLYKRTPDPDEQEEVVYLAEGCSFGKAYRWKQKFLPLTFEETLLAVVPKRQLAKIAKTVMLQRESMIKALAAAKIFGKVEDLQNLSKLLTLHRVPFGTFLIKQGQIPKGIFFLLKGSVSQKLEMDSKTEQNVHNRQNLTVSHYYAGDYFPKCNLTDCMPFNIVADSPCEIISLPKKCLKMMNWMPKREELFKGEEYYRKQLKKQESWDVFKQSYLNNTLNYVSSKPKPMIF